MIINNKVLIALLLISAVVLFYAFFFYKPIANDQIAEIQGVLLEKPIYGEQGGDMPRKYIKIKLVGMSNKFYLSGCAYDMSYSKEILLLEPLDTVVVGIKKESINNNSISVYQFASQDNMLLELNDYNRCHAKKWKMILPIVVIMLIILIYRLVKHHFAQAGASNKSSG